MTRLVRSHRLANQSVLAVCSILNKAGAIAEEIKNDYGEDLLVQTHLSDIADTFHVLVQVKGSKLQASRDRKYRLRISVDHLRRWTSHIQPILLCVYDEGTGRVYAFSPRERFSLWEISTTARKTISLTFGKNEIFNAATARKFIWSCRIDHFSRMLSWHENHMQYADYHAISTKIKENILTEGHIVTLFFLKSLGLLIDDSFDREFRSGIKNGARNFARMNADGKQPQLGLRSLFMLNLLKRVGDVCGSAFQPT